MDAKGFEDIGNRLTTALLSGDLALYLQLITVPLRIEAVGAYVYDLVDEAAVAEDLRLYHDVLTLHGVTDIVREVLDLRPEREGVSVTCRVNIVAHAKRVVDPFRTDMRLVPATGGWRIAQIASQPGHIDWTLGQAGIDTAGNFVRR
jgi:hypothetical protein